VSQNRVSLIIGVHCHQPLGNFDSVFREAYENAYLPFIQSIEKRPKIRVCLHYSGCLLDWLCKERPEFIERIKVLVMSGRVEIMSGGYYEPILPLIPDRDKLGQIRMMNDLIQSKFGIRPSGLWLAERIWEPNLPKILNNAGITYTVVDDFHFRCTGLSEKDTFGYYVTEEEGHELAIFCTSQKLRYAIPFKMPGETLDYLSEVSSVPSRLLVIADDGEKFGMWPGTYKWVYEDGWLENFFDNLEENSEWINLETFGEFLKKQKPLGRIYLPCASYSEMMEWSGGYFRNFLVKYPESNNMHKKMLYVSDALRDAMARFAETGNSTTTSRQLVAASAGCFGEATIELYKAQCNCAYWHGVFGGLYMNHLRAEVYRHLIEAEKLLDARLLGTTGGAGLVQPPACQEFVTVERMDFDRDNSEEILVRSDRINLYFDEDDGGTLFEMDYKPRAVNLMNTITRREEPYHKKLLAEKAEKGEVSTVRSIHELATVKESSLREFLGYDRYRRLSLRDHFLGSDTDVKRFADSSYEQLGDFANMPYAASVMQNGYSASISLVREGTLREQESSFAFRVSKTCKIRAGSSVFDVSYKIENLSRDSCNVWFGIEFNFSLLDKSLSVTGSLERIRKLLIRDEYFGLRIAYNLDRETAVWHFPVYTVSDSESGMERTYQEFCLLFNWKFALISGKSWGVNFTVETEE
jgi:alpha-amylase